MKSVELVELSSPGCSHCAAFRNFWHSIESKWPDVHYKDVSITTPEGQELAGAHMVLAAPGIFLNGELFATGGYDEVAFLKKLEELSK